MHSRVHSGLFNLLLISSIIVFSLSGCETGELSQDILVYENDFEDRDDSNIEGAIFRNALGSQILGNFNNDGFSLHLNDLPEHDFISISFDLLIHDTWDGNSNGLEPDAPDKWIMAVDPGLGVSSLNTYTGFETTFSNGPCDNILCLPQSFPSSYPHHRQPKTGQTLGRRGLCADRANSRGTSIYSIERTFRHETSAIVFRFYDELFQPNVTDQKCDESWSMDNIVVRALKLN